MGGVTSLVGTYDGTKEAAVMVNGLNDTAFGPLFTGPDCYEQIEAFEEWLRRLRFMNHAGEIGLERFDLPAIGRDGDDPRDWPERGLAKVVAYWKSRFLDADGLLLDESTIPM